MRVFCVAEKPSIAKSVAQILSGGQFTTRATGNKYIKNYDFTYPQTNAHFTMTSVSGHLTTHEFDDAHTGWHSCDPFTLFDAPVESRISKEAKDIEKNLLQEARRSDMLMIWTDCDREGEHIGMEIARVCRRVKQNITVRRARFSAIIAQQIHHAAQHPAQLDRAQADAVEARTVLDLRLGAAFTRMQTLALQGRIGQLKEAKKISYGPCQFPTLGFVVARYKQVKDFVSEPFWKIDLSLSRPTSSKKNNETYFTWKRGHLFEFNAAIALYQEVLSNPTARVTKVTNKGTKKWKPLPLTTVELQKAGSRLLRLGPKKVLDVAERLYQGGFLSYPRTETDQFDPQFDLMSLIDKQTVDPDWGAFATGLQQGGFGQPRKGKNNDKAHPPIHPTAHAGNLAGDEKKVYEFVTRRFLGCCSKDAEGWETTIDVLCGGELFYATGLVILERNYLLVYPYDKWNGKEIPEFEEGEEFQPSVCELTEGKTSSPTYLTEADLVNLMDKNGIGTDATIAQHIQTIIDRDYVVERMEGNTKYLLPSKLGIGLIEGYNQIGFDKSLSKPQLRRETERSMVQVCEGTRTKNDMLDQSINQYKEMFIMAKREFNKVVSSVRQYIQGAGQEASGGSDNGDDGGGGGGGARGGRGGRRGRGSGRVAGRGGRGNRGGSAPTSRNNGGGNGPFQAPPRPPHDISDDDDGCPPPAPRRSRGRETVSLASNLSIQVKCRCDVPAAERTVVKESTSKGRRFWTCGKQSSCNFFEWMDGISPDLPNGAGKPLSKTVPAKRSYSDCSGQASAGQTGPKHCQCRLAAIQRTTVKEGPNQGRLYWTCPNGPDAKCAFFEWDDEPANGSRGDQSCFKCGQTGHWASACQNSSNAGDRSKQATSFGSKAGQKVPGSCFRCGLEGHFSNACPGTGSTSKVAVASGGTSDACFRCGETGHWSAACPMGAGGAPPAHNIPASGSKRGRTRSTSKGRSKRGGKKSGFGIPDD